MQISPVSYNSYTPYKYGKYNNSCSFTAKSPVRIGVLKNADDVSYIAVKKCLPLPKLTNTQIKFQD